MAKTKHTYVPAERFPHHFYASSAVTWKVDYDPEKLIQAMKKEGNDFGLWLVPGKDTDHYSIDNYAPVVDGAVYVGRYNVD